MANYDPARDDLGYTRLLISDTDNGDRRIFTDDEMRVVLKREGNAKLAAAVLLLIIAQNEAMVAKVIRTQDLQTDGAKLSAELRALAAAYRVDGLRDRDIAAVDEDAPVIVEYSANAWRVPELTEYPADPYAWENRW